MEPDYGIVVVFEMPLQEVYFIDTNKLGDNPVQKSYKEVIVDAIDNEDENFGMITISDSIAISSGGYQDMSSALVDTPCVVTNALYVDVETE